MPDHLLRFLCTAGLAMLPLVVNGQGVIGRTAPSQASGAPSEAGVSVLPVPTERPSGALNGNRRLQPGDQLSFKIEQDPDPAVPLIVTHSGDLVIDVLDRAVHVGDLTASQAAAEIKRQLDKDYYYDATVRLTLEKANVAATMGYVYLSGAVARTGALPIYAEQPLKLSEAILNAGGFGRFADDRRVQITRGTAAGAQTSVIDVKAILQEGRLANDMLLQAGDRIFVKETSFRFK